MYAIFREREHELAPTRRRAWCRRRQPPALNLGALVEEEDGAVTRRAPLVGWEEGIDAVVGCWFIDVEEVVVAWWEQK